MVYSAEHPPVPSSAELRERIPGWGADLDHADRPSVPRLKFDPAATGAHWDLPEQQPEKSPVFGTSSPTRGLSGFVRRYSYRTYSEGRAAHWLLLLGADRIDAIESHLASFLTLHPDNPFTETGVRSEFTHHGFKSRTGTTRVDNAHTWLDPLIVVGPWLAAAALIGAGIRAMSRPMRRVRR
jgi:hypothetical protein